MAEDGAVAVGGAGKVVTRLQDSEGAMWRRCRWCDKPFLARRRDQSCCSGRCADHDYNRRHPVARVANQPALDFTPAARDLAEAVRGRDSKARRIVARLAQGPATTWDLARISLRFSARLHELEAEGLRYEREDHKGGGSEHSVYRMTQPPAWWGGEP